MIYNNIISVSPKNVVGKMNELRNRKYIAHPGADEDVARAFKGLICAASRCAAGSPH
jgi:hypothetical protein